VSVDMYSALDYPAVYEVTAISRHEAGNSLRQLAVDDYLSMQSR
jgi:hypothetical protein